MNESFSRRPAIDHCVLPTADLAVARQRLTQLGFTVAPDGLHPFGTQNCCVYFSDGTFLEPLAVGDAAVADKAGAEGNMFVARDRLFRHRNGDEGFSALVLGSDDAAADDARFLADGISAGSMLNFSRAVATAAGQSDTASFRLAFAGEARMPDAFFFACERVNVPRVDRSALQRHPNGVLRIETIGAETGRDPGSAAFLETLFGVGGVQSEARVLRFDLSNGVVTLRQTVAPSEVSEPSSSIRLTAIGFGVADLPALEALFQANAIRHHWAGDRIAVPPTAGQGATFIFGAFSP